MNRILLRCARTGPLAAALLFSSAWLLLQTSCGGRQSTTREITFAAALLPSEQASYTAILDSFTAKSGVSVRLISQQYNQIRTTIEAEAQAGEGELDVAELDVYLLPIEKGYMQPLDTLMRAAEVLRGHVPAQAWQAGRFGDPERLLYVPHRLNWQALVYDASVLSAPPGSWEELLSVARSHPGAIGLKCAQYEGLVCDVFPFVWQAGGDVLKPGSRAALQAMTFLKRLRPYLNPAVRSYKENSILQAQEHREIVLHPNWPFVVPLLRENGLLHRSIETAPLPAGPTGSATVLGGGYLGIPHTAPHPNDAARLLDFLTSVEAQKLLVAQLGWFPIRDEGWLAMTERDRADFAGYLAMKDDVHARPNVPYYPEVSQIWQDGFYRIVFDGEDAATELARMQERIDALSQSRAE